MPDDSPGQAQQLLQRLLELTGQLQQALSGSEDGLGEAETDARIAALLDQRQDLLDQLAALSPEQRHLSPVTQDLLARVQTQAEALLDALEAWRSSLTASSSELRTAHSAMRAYLPAHQSESRYFEEET